MTEGATQNQKPYESLLTPIYLCRDCRDTFIVDKPAKPSSWVLKRKAAKKR